MFIKFIGRTFILVLLFLGAYGNANATTLDYNFDIKITYADVTNPFGLAVGDIMSASITIDTAYGKDNGTYSTHTPKPGSDYYDPSLSVALTMGGTTYNETDDITALSWPFVTAWLSDWSIDSFDLFLNDGSIAPNIHSYINISELNGLQAYSAVEVYSPGADPNTGHWSLLGDITGSLKPIPEPTTIVLLGLGLLGLAGVSRRSRQ